MKKITIAACLVAFLFACNSEDKKSEEAKVASSTDSKKEWIPMDSAAAMQKMMEYGTPGDAHAMLARSNGTWTAETTMWMSEGSEPSKSTATCVNEMIMGGRYQRSSFSGDMDGMPFEGMSITGYDNAKKVYTSTWIDNWGTGIMKMEGTWDDAAKSINFTGKAMCLNGIETDVKEVFKVIDDNTEVMEMYGPDLQTGKMYKNMEIKFTRNK
jgi:hypothetical protein